MYREGAEREGGVREGYKAGTLPLMHMHTHTFGFVMATVPSSEFVVMMLPRFSASSLPNRGRQRTTTFTASRLMVAVVVGVGEAAQANAYYAKGSRHGKSLLRQQRQHTTNPNSNFTTWDVGVHCLCVWRDCACLMCGWGGQGRLSAQRAAGKLCSAGRGPIAACRFVVEAGARRDQSHQSLLSLVVVHSSTLG